MATTLRTVRVGGASYPLVLPRLADPRLHLASVIITVHVLGQTLLGFRVSVPQILSAILAAAVLEVGITFAQKKEVVWPASAMLTGSGVALILRQVGMSSDQPWSFSGWYLFVVVAGVSLLTKYLIRFRGTHVFNPSNVGLVAAFLLLGSDMIEPLDFWWGPPSPGLVIAYAVITVGGVLITSRLRLLGLAAAFWIALAAGLGIVAASGHCMTAAWSLGAVCGWEFWSVVMFSPELLVFLFFMITDPKTVPESRSGRAAFGVLLGVACALLIAPQTTEFGAKVALLGGLVVLTPLRYLIAPRFEEDRSVFDRLVAGQVFRKGLAIGTAGALLSTSLVAAGLPARPVSSFAAPVVDVAVDAATLPTVVVSPEAGALNTSADPQAIAVDLVEDLTIENQALLSGDTSLLRAADDGERLLEMERVVETAATQGNPVVYEYRFETLALEVVFTDGPQGGASLALAATGTRSSQAGSEPFATTFVLSPGNGNQWLITKTID